MKSSDHSFGFLLADISRLLRNQFQARLTGSELTHAQARALIHISRNPGVRQVELAELLNIQPITLARQLDQLVASNLVERRAHPTDRRAYCLYTLPDAKQHLVLISAVAMEIKAMATAGLSQDEIDQVLVALNKIRSNLTP
ncbi:MarR family winged helix-turn-helix transcriptional regulator [Teredinibacter turnerae]|uniref:MarR family winged helix-turn-helix transcriptional regulator n=1 Tax=Teredinibacter turnerae TaxID=2426 RepID=UPI0030D3A91B